MQLTGREQKMVGFAGVAVGIFVLLQFAVFPLFEHRSRLQKRLQSQEKAVVEMRLLREQYLRMHQQSGDMASQLAQRQKGFSLFAFLEQQADESEVKDRIASMKPSETQEGALGGQSRVEMKLQAVSLEQLLRFLDATESPENLVGVGRIAIQENSGEDGGLDVTLMMISVDQPPGSAGL
jgi:general secretion pathway protein M